MGKYDDLIGGFKVEVDVVEVLNEAAANKVDDRIKQQKAELEKPIEINVKSDKAENQLKALHKAAQKVKDELQDAISSQKGFEEVNKLVTKYGLLKKQIGDIAPVVGKNNATLKASNKILKDTKKLVDQLTVSQDKLNKTQNKRSKKAVTTIVDNSKDSSTTPANTALETKLRTQEKINAELAEEEERLKRIEAQEKKNEVARNALKKKQANYGQEVLGVNHAVYDTDLIKGAKKELEEFNKMLETRNKFEEKYIKLCQIVERYYINDQPGKYAIGNGMYKNLDKFFELTPDIRQLEKFSENGQKTTNKAINELFKNVARGLQSELDAVSRMIVSGEVSGDIIGQKLDKEEIDLNKEMQRLYDERIAQESKIVTLKREELDLIIQQGKEEAKNAEARLKLTKKKNNDGKIIPETYTAANGRFSVEKGTTGWNVYDEHGKGMSELFAQYDTLKDLRVGLAEFLREEVVEQEKLNDTVETQVKATEKLAETRLKLTPKKEGGYTIPETYVSDDGKFEVSKSQSGWDVYQRDNAGMYNLIATYKHLDDVRKDSSLLAREEIVFNDEIVGGLHTLQEAYRALGHQMQGRKPVVDTYLDLLMQIKSGALSAADAIEQFNGVVGNTQPKQQDTSSNDILAKANILAEFTQLSGQLALQHVGTEKYDAIVGKIEEINNGIINTGVSLEDATKQLNEFISGLKNANVVYVHTQAISQIPQLVDNYGACLDEVNNKLMQGTTLLNEQTQVLRLFHNSSEIFDTFDMSKAGSNQGQALGLGTYLALRQNGEFNDLTYGRYQTQWYANVQNAFNVRDKLTDKQSADVIDKFMADRAEGFKQHMLSKLLDGDVVTAIKDIAEISKTNVGEIFGYLGYDAIIDGAQVNIFDPSKIFRANNSVLDIGTGEFDAFRDLQKQIWDEQKIIDRANRQIEELSNQYSGKTKEELDSDLFTETLLRSWNWKEHITKIASAFLELTGELPKVDGVTEESLRAMVDNYEFIRQELQGYQDTVNEHQKILDQLIAQRNERKESIHATTQSYLSGNISGIVNIEAQDSPAVGTLDHLVDSLLKLDSISADPLNEIVKSIVNGEKTISSEVQAILKSLNLLDDTGTFTGKYITEGVNNSGVITNDRYAIIARNQEHYDEPESYEYDFKEGTTYIDNLIAKEKEAAEQGINLARVLKRVKSEATNGEDLFYEIQEFAPGEQLHAFDESKKNIQDFEKECARLTGATSEHIQKLMSDIIKLNDLGFFIDFSPANILYDTEKGFSLIDLALRDLGLEAQTTTELMEGLITCLIGLEGNEERIRPNTEDAIRWSSSMLSVYNNLGAIFGQNNFGADITSIASKFSGDFAKYMGEAEHPQVAQQTTIQIKAQAEAEQDVAEAVHETTNALREQNEVVGEIAKTESKLGKQAFRGLGLNEFFKRWQIPTKDREPIKQELYKLAEMYSADKFASDDNAQYPNQYNKVVNMLIDSLKADKAENIYEDFLNWMRDQVVAYDPNDPGYAAEFKDTWASVRQRHSKWIVSSEKNSAASYPDTFFESIPEKFLHLFSELDYNLDNQYNQLQALVDVMDAGREAKTLTDAEGLEQTIMALSEHFATDLFLPMVDKVDQIIDSSEDEAIKIVQKNVDKALAQLRNAHNNQNAMIDLSAVSSPGDLEEQIGELVTKSLNADLTVGAVKIQDNIAQISLYNKELGLTQQQTWALERSTEDAMEAQLKLIKADPLKVNFEQAAKYAEAQQKKVDSSTKWLLNAQKKLDTQKRDYQHSQKKIDGSTELFNFDATTLEKDADKTIDGLVKHIQKRINDSADKLITNELKNQITKDLNALENEIQIRQLEKYTDTTMSASEVEAARKVIVDTIDTIALNAQDKNIFDSIRESYESLRARLTDPSVEGYIKNNFTDAINEMRTLRSSSSKSSAEERMIQNLLKLQEKLYNAKRKQAELNLKGQFDTAEAQAAKRLTDELQAQYEVSLQRISSMEQTSRILQQELALQQELNAAINEQRNQIDQKHYTSQNYLGELVRYEDNIGDNTSSNSGASRSSGGEGSSNPTQIREQYQSILNLVNEINTKNSKIVSDTKKDSGTGILQGYIQSVKQDKQVLIQQLEAVKTEVNNTLGDSLLLGQKEIKLDSSASLGTDIKVIEDFLNDARVQAVLTKDEIDALLASFSKARDIDVDFLGDQIAEKKEMLKQVKKENLYFADKTQFADNLGIDDIQKLGTVGSTTKEKLELLAQTIAKNSNGAVALTKSFTQGADGIAKLDFSVFDQNTNSMRDFTVAMGTATKQFAVFETTASKSLATTNAASKQLEAAYSTLGTLSLSGVNVEDGAAPAQVQKLLNLINELKRAIDAGDENLITKLTKDMKITLGETDKLYKQMLQIDDLIANKQATGLGKGDPTTNAYNQLVDATKHWAEAQGATVEFGRFDAATNTLNASLVKANGTVENFKVSMNALNGQMGAQQTGVTKLTSTWDQFKASVGKAGKQLLTAFAGYNVFYKVISEVRKGIGYVKEIDLALTELKKVTDETEASYAAFLKTAASTSGKIGSTVSDFTEATANFARLGYTMEESANMAETAIVYRNVADGLDTVEEATDSIISTMKAFGIESDNTMQIIDVFNEVGKYIAQ